MTVEPIALFLLWLMSRKNGSTSLFSATPAANPSAFPPVPAAPPLPPPVAPPHTSIHTGGKWVPYAPLNAQVIARAEELLHDRTMRPNDERIEPDPASGGQVRYLKLAAPPGHVSVTAWKPTLSPPVPAAPPGATPASMPPSTALAPASASGRVLKRGMRGPDVAQWQARLGLAADGVFGKGTEAATMAFQRAHGLAADGVVGPATRNAASLAAA